jgi:hypothetical protein
LKLLISQTFFLVYLVPGDAEVCDDHLHWCGVPQLHHLNAFSVTIMITGSTQYSAGKMPIPEMIAALIGF